MEKQKKDDVSSAAQTSTSAQKEPDVIFENDDFVIVEKPAGLLVHAVRVSARSRSRKVDEVRRKEPTLAEWITARYPEVASVGDDPEFRPGIVHRLDKETSGIMVVARTQESFKWLKEAFRARAMEKRYLAFVYGVPSPEKGTIDRPIGIRNGTLKRSVHSSAMAKEAVTEYEVKKICKEAAYALVEVHPRTGRTHQIRVHLASIGNPIVGDALYAPKRVRRAAKAVGEKAQTYKATRLMLHALSIAFSSPKGEHFVFTSSPPNDFMEVIHIYEDRV